MGCPRAHLSAQMSSALGAVRCYAQKTPTAGERDYGKAQSAGAFSFKQTISSTHRANHLTNLYDRQASRAKVTGALAYRRKRWLAPIENGLLQRDSTAAPKNALVL